MYESEKPACVWLVKLCDDYRRSVVFCSDNKFVVWDDLDGIYVYRSEII
jgi:hypothetical protein